MPYEGEVPLTPIELQARGLMPPGPLAPPMTPGAPLTNEQAIKDKAQEVVSQLPGVEVRPGIRQVPPGTPVTELPSPGQYVMQNFMKNLPSIAGMTAATVIPGGGGAVSGPLARTLAGGGAAGGAAALQGKGLGESAQEGAAFGAGQLGGEVVGGMARAGANKLLYSQFAKDSAGKLADLVKKNVPAWGAYASDAKGLHEMIYGKEGQARLSAEFDKALKAGVKAAREQGIRVPITTEDAEKLGLVSGGLEGLEALRGDPAKNIRMLLPSMPAGDVAEKIVGWWKKDPAMYRRVVNALDEAGVGDPAARRAYKWGSGFAQFMDKTKALRGEEYYPERAVAGLSNLKTVNELRRRGMGEVMDLVRGPGESPLSVTHMGPWQRHWAGALLGGGLGGAAGLATGNPMNAAMGASGGGGLGVIAMPSNIYHNVPLSEGAKTIFQSGPTALGQLGREFFQATSS